MHHAEYLKAHPDAAPVGADGKVSPPPDGWQGLCPTHAGYRENRMNAFRAVLADCAVDGVWLDYHHSHASWEQAVPVMPDTCFCERCLALFQEQTGLKLPKKPAAELSRLLLGEYRQRWIRWRCDVFTDWVREYRAILDRTRPGALLGTFHCPWSDTDLGGALESGLAIDLKAQAQYIDVFSPMPYHARFGHLSDPGWISRQVSWLGNHLGVRGEPGERLKIWPIVQASDWGEAVAGKSDRSRARPRHAAARNRGHGLRLGRAQGAAGENRGDRPVLSRHVSCDGHAPRHEHPSTMDPDRLADLTASAASTAHGQPA